MARQGGLLNTARYAASRLDDAIAFSRLGIYPAIRQTRGAIALGYTNPDQHLYSAGRESYRVFRTLMDTYVHPTPADSFLDYGSGLGKILLLAATYPLQRVIGVEYSAALVERARGIISEARPRLRCHVEIVHADAGAYRLPDDVTILFFYNPFSGEVLRRVVTEIERSLQRSPRPIRILYHGPRHFERVTQGCRWVDKRAELAFPWLAADPIAIFQARLA